jgi:DNA polymerase III epsilon subunit-like protein
VMLDLETLGTAPGCAIISIGACVFDTDGPRDTFHRVINVHSCRLAGLAVDEGTVKWWQDQTEDARGQTYDVAMAVSGGTDLGPALHEFEAWLAPLELRKGIAIWGNGADFDQPILAAAYRACGYRSPPWRPYSARCYRTLKNMMPSVIPIRDGVHHNALDDAKTQAIHAVNIIKALNLQDTIF